jgi:hypothetical protein
MRLRRTLTIASLVCTLGASQLWCQQPQSASPSQQQTAPNTQPSNPAGQSVTPGQPIPAITPSTGPVEVTPSTTPTPATQPLAGAEMISPELPGSTHSYILPSFSLWEGADSNSLLVPGQQQFEAATIPVGAVDLNVVSRSNQFGLNYGGGGMIYDTSLGRSAWFQDGGFTDTYTTRRWSFLVSDRASYLPQASSGFAGIGYAGIFNNAQFLGVGSGQSQLNPISAPGQSVLTGQFAATSNVSIAQAEYQLNPTNSLSVTGSFGITRFEVSSSLQSGTNTLSVFSWDHQLSSTDSLSVSYSLVRYRYNGGSVAINSNLWRVGYGRRISHRMSFFALIGPQLNYSAFNLVPGVQKSLTLTGQARLSYQLQRLSFYASYLQYVSPGSGVFQGSKTDDTSAGLDARLTRNWDLSLSGGDSRNTALEAYSVNPAFPNPGVVQYEYGTVRLNHVLSRYTRVFAVYDLQHQTSGAAFVPGSTSTALFRHVFGIGLELHPRPVGL